MTHFNSVHFQGSIQQNFLKTADIWRDVYCFFLPCIASCINNREMIFRLTFDLCDLLSSNLWHIVLLHLKNVRAIIDRFRSTVLQNKKIKWHRELSLAYRFCKAAWFKKVVHEKEIWCYWCYLVLLLHSIKILVLSGVIVCIL